MPIVSAAERRWLLIASGLVSAVTLLPFAICALAATRSEAVFAGFLFNPVDGFTYLAKMRMGWQGNWLYHSPFTLEQGPGGLLFTFYFALGHLARLLDLPLLELFHIARVVCNFLLLWVVYGFIARATDVISLRRLMWWLVALSSGLGWVVVKYGLGYSYYEQQAILYMNTFYVLLIAPHLQTRVTFDPLKSLTPVAGTFIAPLMIITGNGVPAKTPEELIRLLKASPGKYSYASSGVGTVQHLGFEMFKARTGTFVLQIGRASCRERV